MLKNVVFPAPFGPIKLTISPVGTVKSTSSTATRPPNSLRNICVSSSTSCTCVLRVVQRLVVHAFVELCGDSRARNQPLWPDKHHDNDDQSENAELVLRDRDARSQVLVDLPADVRETLTVEIREETCAEDHAPDVSHPAENDHAQDEHRDLEEEVVRKRAALV